MQELVPLRYDSTTCYRYGEQLSFDDPVLRFFQSRRGS